MHIGQAEVAAGMAEGELLVVEAEQVKHGRVQIMDVHLLVHCAKTKFICRAMHVTAARAAAGQPYGEPVMIMIAAVDLPGVRAMESTQLSPSPDLSPLLQEHLQLEPSALRFVRQDYRLPLLRECERARAQKR